MENDIAPLSIAPLNIGLVSTLRKAQVRIDWRRFLSMATPRMEFANDDDDIRDSEHRLKLPGLKYILVQ